MVIVIVTTIWHTRVEWVRRLPLWKHYRDFFPIHLIKTCELDPSKNYIMGYHPHGILSAGAFCHFATEGTNFSKVNTKECVDVWLC